MGALAPWCIDECCPIYRTPLESTEIPNHGVALPVWNTSKNLHIIPKLCARCESLWDIASQHTVYGNRHHFDLSVGTKWTQVWQMSRVVHVIGHGHVRSLCKLRQALKWLDVLGIVSTWKLLVVGVSLPLLKCHKQIVLKQRQHAT